MSDRQKVLFIGGLGRSGTTLIEKLLNEIPQTVAVGETIHLWERGVRDHERCGCGKDFTECPIWMAIGHEAFGGWDKVDLDRIIDLRWSVDRSRKLPQIMSAHKTGRLSEDQRSYLDFLRPVLVAAGKLSGAEVVLDSSKHLSSAALLALDPALDVSVLHVVRDPRGVAYSWTKEINRPEVAAESADAQMPTYKPSRTAMRWVTDNLGFDALSKLGVPTLRLRYEDFLVDPVGATRSALELVGLTNADLSFLSNEGAHIEQPMHSVAGNPMRFGGDDLVFRLDDAWKTKLDPTSLRTVTRITRPVLGHYGYDATVAG